VRWPGTTHDSRIFDNSALCARFENHDINGVLLGDNGYPLRPFLMTPLLATRTDAERRFNTALSRARVKIEHTFGVLKRRFPCLTLDLRLKVQTSLRVITACAVLYNFAKERREPLPEIEPLADVARPNVPAQRVDREVGGRALREVIIRNFDGKTIQ